MIKARLLILLPFLSGHYGKKSEFEEACMFSALEVIPANISLYVWVITTMN